MEYKNVIEILVAILIIAGALNWGVVGVSKMVGDKTYDLVTMVTPGYPMVENIIKIVIGVAAIYYVFALITPYISGRKSGSEQQPESNQMMTTPGSM